MDGVPDSVNLPYFIYSDLLRPGDHVKPGQNHTVLGRNSCDLRGGSRSSWAQDPSILWLLPSLAPLSSPIQS